MNIDRVATFRGNVVDHGVSLTKNEFPQLVFNFVAKEIWDADEGAWVDWSDVAQNEIMAYLVLFGGSGETLNAQQVKKAFGWDGLSFQGLNNMDLSKTSVQVRVEEHTYDSKTTLQVNWIDDAEAIPGKSVRKLDASDLKQLDAKYAAAMKATGAKSAPVKVTAKSVKPTSPKGPVKKTDKTETATEAVIPALPTAPIEDGKTVGHCTKDDAWNTCVEMRGEANDEQLAKSWLDNIQKVAPGKKQDDLTEQEWCSVRELTLDETAVF